MFKIINWLKVSSRFGLIISVIRHSAVQSFSFVIIFILNILFFASIQVALGAEVEKHEYLGLISNMFFNGLLQNLGSQELPAHKFLNKFSDTVDKTDSDD